MADNFAKIRKAAEHGDASAQYNLGIMYDCGRDVPKDYTQAALWYGKAAAQGYPPAQSNLGAAYFEGQGVAQDYVQAITWYRKAAENGEATAQFNLGAAYLDGQGVSQDYGEAYFWLACAASSKSESIKADDVEKFKTDAASHLSDSDVAQIRERVRTWLQEHTRVSAGEGIGAPDTSSAKRSGWRTIVGWALIVIGVWGGLQKLFVSGGESHIDTLITMAFLIVAGIGLLSKIRIS